MNFTGMHGCVAEKCRLTVVAADERDKVIGFLAYRAHCPAEIVMSLESRSLAAELGR